MSMETTGRGIAVAPGALGRFPRDSCGLLAVALRSIAASPVADHARSGLQQARVVLRSTATA
jgi:hypothetical protein